MVAAIPFIIMAGAKLVETQSSAAGERTKAEGILRLFWTDIAANWFAPAQRLGGAGSGRRFFELRVR